jgi:hypothetical protein
MKGTQEPMPAVRRLAPYFAAVLVLLAILPASAGAASASREQRQEMFGLGGWAWPNSGEIAALSGRGLRSWRVTMSWPDIEPHRGQRLWAGWDRLVQELASRHVQVIFTLTACPRWACDHGGPPRSEAGRSAWVEFVRAAVRRYGVGGALWREHPGLPAKPVIHWQVLNEVNGPDQWGGPPSAAGYADFLKLTASAIRGTDPNAKVVLAGLGEKMPVWLRDYLPALYRQPGFAGDFDVMAVEGYAPRPRDLRRIFRTTRRTMRRNGDLAKPIWITEMSWSTGGGAHPFVTSERGQARRLRAAYDLLLACHRAWNLGRVYWFAHRDKPVPAGSGDYWGYHNGLIAADGRWKPSMRAFLRYLRVRAPRVRAASCGR